MAASLNFLWLTSKKEEKWKHLGHIRFLDPPVNDFAEIFNYLLQYGRKHLFYQRLLLYSATSPWSSSGLTNPHRLQPPPPPPPPCGVFSAVLVSRSPLPNCCCSLLFYQKPNSGTPALLPVAAWGLLIHKALIRNGPAAMESAAGAAGLKSFLPYMRKFFPNRYKVRLRCRNEKWEMVEEGVLVKERSD